MKKRVLAILIAAMMFLCGIACGSTDQDKPQTQTPDTTTQKYDDYFVIDTSLVNTQVQCGEEISFPISVTNLGEPVSNPNYGISIKLNGQDVTDKVYRKDSKTAVFEEAGTYSVRFVILKDDGSEAANSKGEVFSETVEIEAMGLAIEGSAGEEAAVIVDNDALNITFTQAVAEGTPVGQYSLKGVNLSGDFEVSFKVRDMGFVSTSPAKIFIGFVRNTLNEEEDSISIGPKDKQFHAYVANVTGSDGWTTGGYGFIDSVSTVLDSSGVHEIKIGRKITDGKAVWSIYYDGEFFASIDAGSEYTDLIKRVYFTADQCSGKVYDIKFTGMVKGGAEEKRAETDIFDLSKTSGVARTMLGYCVYTDVYDEANRALLDNAEITFSRDGKDVTAEVFDKARSVFCAPEDGQYLMKVTAVKDGVTYESTRIIEAWANQASMYAFGEVDTAFGTDLKNIAVGKDGAISFTEMDNAVSPKINYLTKVSKNWDVIFTAKGLNGVGTDPTAPTSRLAFTLILANNNTGALYFDDMFIEQAIGGESWGFSARINSVSSDLVRYSWISNGLHDTEARSEFDPNEGQKVPVNSDLAGEHTYRISCRTSESGIVTYYYYIDGELWAKHNTSVYNGTSITSHNNVSTLLGFQVLSRTMEGSITSLKIVQSEYDGPAEIIDGFDLNETTATARTGLGHKVYYTAKTNNADVAKAEVKFTLGGEDVTAKVYDANAQVFRPDVAGDYTMSVGYDNYLSEKAISVTDDNAKLYKFSEVDTTWGASIDKTVVTKDGVIFENMAPDGKAAKYNVVTNVANNWEIKFKTKDMYSSKADGEWPFAALKMTLIIGSDTKQGLVFDDLMLQGKPGDDCWGWASIMSGSSEVAYAWAAWGVTTKTDEFKPSADYAYKGLSFMGEHDWKVVCNMDESGIVTFKFYMDGELFAVHNTSTQYGNAIANHNEFSRLYGVQFYSEYMNAEVYGIEVNQLDGSGPFNLDNTTSAARTGLGHKVYYTAASGDVDAAKAAVKFTLNGEDVTAKVYDAETQVFRPDVAGEYLMSVGYDNYLAEKVITVTDDNTKLYKFSELDTTWGSSIDKTIVTEDGIIFKDLAPDGKAAKYNVVVNVVNNWEIKFKTKDMYSSKTDGEWPFAALKMTLIIGSDTKQGLVFDDLMLQGKPGDDCWGWASIMSGSSEVAYAWAAWGVTTKTDEFKPSADYAYKGLSFMGEHDWKIVCNMDDTGIVTFKFYMDGELFAVHNTSSQYGSPITAHDEFSHLYGVQFYSEYMNAEVYGIEVNQLETSPLPAGQKEAAEQPFNMDGTTGTARTGLGHKIYYKAGMDGVDAAKAEVKFTLGGQDVTAKVYDASTQVFRPDVAGDYTMSVGYGDNLSEKIIVVTDDNAKLYKFSEVDTTWGSSIDKTTVTEDGVIFADLAPDGKAAKYNVVVNVANNWEIKFKTKDMYSSKTDGEWPFAALKMTLIIGSDTKQGLVFDDLMLQGKPGDDCWGWASIMSGSSEVAYAWAAWGVTTKTDEFKPSADYAYKGLSFMGEHDWKVVCNMDESGIVTFSFYMDGELFAVHNTSTQYGNAIANHNEFSHLYGVQFYSEYMNAEVYGIEVNQLD